MRAKCVECERVFDLSNEDDAAEWNYGHDCETAEDRAYDAMLLADYYGVTV